MEPVDTRATSAVGSGPPRHSRHSEAAGARRQTPGQRAERASQEPACVRPRVFTSFLISRERRANIMEMKVIFEVKQAPPPLKERRGREMGRQAGPGWRLRSPRGEGTGCPEGRAVVPSLFTNAASRGGSPGRGCGLTRTDGWTSEQNVVLERPGDPVDHEPPVVTQGRKEPGVG